MSAHTLPGRIGVSAVMNLAWPICISMLSYTAMTVADTIFVGQLGTAPLAAIGLAASAIHAGTAFGHGLIGGMRVTVARATGALQPLEARANAWQGLWIGLVLGGLVATLAPLGPWIFPAMGASDEVSELASDYYAWRTAAAPVVFLYVGLSAWFQGRGDTKTPMVGTVLGNAVNVALDPVLIFGWGDLPAGGVAGAAQATVLGMGVGVCWLAIRAWRELWAGFTLPDRARILEIWRIGSPTGTQHLLDVLSFGWFAALLAHAGDAHLAAHVVVVRIAMVSFLPGYALGEASGVLVGQALGARRPWLARDANRAATRLAVGLMLGCALLFVAIPDLLIAVFGAAPGVVAVARQALLVAAALQVVDAIATVALGSLAGAGDTRFVMVATVAVTWLCKVPLCTLLVVGADLGVVGAWLGLALEVSVLAAIAAWRVRGDRWLAV